MAGQELEQGCQATGALQIQEALKTALEQEGGGLVNIMRNHGVRL